MADFSDWSMGVIPPVPPGGILLVGLTEQQVEDPETKALLAQLEHLVRQASGHDRFVILAAGPTAPHVATYGPDDLKAAIQQVAAGAVYVERKEAELCATTQWHDGDWPHCQNTDHAEGRALLRAMGVGTLACTCGEPESEGVHRVGAPCYLEGGDDAD